MEAAYSSESLVSIYKTPQYNSPEDHYLHYGLSNKGISKPLQTSGARPRKDISG
jgi:hypothetical protein